MPTPETSNDTGHAGGAADVTSAVANNLFSSEKEFTPMMAQATTLAAQIGTDWDDLDDFERDCLHQLDGAGICLELLQYLAAASTSNRAEVA